MKSRRWNWVVGGNVGGNVGGKISCKNMFLLKLSYIRLNFMCPLHVGIVGFEWYDSLII